MTTIELYVFMSYFKQKPIVDHLWKELESIVYWLKNIVFKGDLISCVAYKFK
jgi:hypothetical protein